MFISLCLKKKNFPVSKDNQLRDFCYVDDIVNAVVLSLIKKRALGEVFNAGSGKPVSVKFIIDKISQIIKHGKPQFNKIPFRKNENLKFENHKIYSIFRLRGSLVLKLCEFIVLMSTLKPVNMSF